VPLGDWVREHKPPALDRADFIKGKRSWYARDRGETMLREIQAMLHGERPVAPTLAAGPVGDVLVRTTSPIPR
jgi:hypothetical protein